MKKIAIISICLHAPYWIYQKRMMDSARKFLLKGHQVDFLVWTDNPKPEHGGIIFPTQPIVWPIPTLFRYGLFLQQEEKLKEYDYLFYLDSDMQIVSRVGDEILGDLVCAQHPMYAIKREYVPPYEPNEKSEAFIKMPGRVIEIDGKKRFEPIYAAGGFQGGRSENFIKAMKMMKEMLDTDFQKNNYIPIWNDESIWNKYLLNHPAEVILSPSYVYPDSLVIPYYRKLWGRNYCPKIVSITKPFTLSQEGGMNLQKLIT